jgi:diguanylate cyclase (GGDEF)-like protein
LARLGGDEFAILLEGAEEPMRVAQRLVEGVAGAGCVEGLPDGAGVTLSVGVAVSRPRSPTVEPTVQAQLLLRRADTAMYLAKAGGKNRAVRAPEVDQPSVTSLDRSAARRGRTPAQVAPGR